MMFSVVYQSIILYQAIKRLNCKGVIVGFFVVSLLRLCIAIKKKCGDTLNPLSGRG